MADSGVIADDSAADGGVPVSDAAVPSCVEAGTCKRVFVTSQQWDGLLGGSGGIDEGNSRCREAAAAFDGGANWVAWLSDGFNHRALARVGKGEWILTDGTLAAVFTTDDPKTVGPSGLTLVHQINRTELGTEVAVAVWTGTGATGGAAYACGAWRRTDLMGTTGLSSSSKTEWTTASSTSSCAAPASLYCFEE